jgi:rare lipoprotein A
LAVVLAAVTVAACAQSSGLTDRSGSPGASRLVAAPSEPSRSAERTQKATFVASRANVTNRQAAETTEASSGLASFYGQEHGNKTANGENYNSRELTAAHRTLPFGTRVRVTNVASGRSVTVRVNDRGPFVPGRVIDVSQAAAEQLGMVGRGVAKVKLDVVQ